MCCWYLVLAVYQHGMAVLPHHYTTRETCIEAGEGWKKDLAAQTNYTPRYVCTFRPNK